MAKQTELKIGYSVNVKANLGNYESAGASIEESETWDVSDLKTQKVVDAFYDERLEALRKRLGKQIELEYDELKS